MKYKAIACSIACLGAFAGACFYLSSPFSTGSAISCHSRHTLINNDFKLDASYGFIFGGNKGELTMYGYAIEDGVRVNIRRVISFTYTKMDNIYTLHSKRVEKFYGDNSEKGNVNIHLPEFFYQTGKDITMQLNRDSFNVPIIFVHRMPVFYCNKSG
ncbi:hypothetical protein [Klebsiella aerogenes]|mgnify:CR=1 FL=1|uniref:hypothetical protein n=1 Tax=Klebsiella aerogenes TaxID=548 RepID=UPI0021D262D6|nr:hypothetical protein [Klebsiella aerogenes]MCU6424429.1 hypothetical protein [Klebsiella aerogenes]HEM8661716.1 hypothetical protein [Klebsiella aerogenes]